MWGEETVQDAAAAMLDGISAEWLLGGNNTLYLVAPAQDQHRLKGLFSALIQTVVAEAFKRHAGDELDPAELGPSALATAMHDLEPDLDFDEPQGLLDEFDDLGAGNSSLAGQRADIEEEFQGFAYGPQYEDAIERIGEHGGHDAYPQILEVVLLARDEEEARRLSVVGEDPERTMVIERRFPARCRAEEPVASLVLVAEL